LDTKELGEDKPDARHPYLRALLAAQVPVDQVIVQAETMGFTPEEMLPIAEALVPPGPFGTSMAAVLLLLGTARYWRPFVPWALVYGIRFIEPLLHRRSSEFDPLERLLDGDSWDLLGCNALERLGYPLQKRLGGSVQTAGSTVLPWLEQDLGLVLDGLELTRFASRAQAWSQVLVDCLILRDGAGPVVLGHASGVPWPATTRSTRLHRVRRLRTLEGLQHVSSLVATDCPRLENLDCTPPIVILKGCPSLRWIRANPRSRLLHLEDCRRLRSIGAERVWDPSLGDRVTPSHQTVVLSRCPALRDLPDQLNVTGHMALRGIGPIQKWPSDFRVGGDLRLKDCPHIEELPALEVRGCLRVEGESGLRRLEPGTVIGRHLDLQACSHLEGIPHGVKVGGAMFLPAHLHRQGPAFEVQEPILEVPVDHYPVLRTLLLGLSFPGLSMPSERRALREHAETALESLRGELVANPRVEAELLWTASEVWRDLSEELWAEQHPRFCDCNESDDDLPLAWFRGLLLSA